MLSAKGKQRTVSSRLSRRKIVIAFLVVTLLIQTRMLFQGTQNDTTHSASKRDLPLNDYYVQFPVLEEDKLWGKDFDWVGEMRSAMEIVKHQSIPDSVGQFRISRYVTTAQAYSSYVTNGTKVDRTYWDITMATQCSLASLRDLPTLAQRWQGPLSVAVFHANNNVGEAIQEIVSMRYCSATVRQYASFHLVYPYNASSSAAEVPLNLELLPCDYFRETNVHENGTSEAQRKHFALETPFPINLMRNEARKAIFTEYVFLIDIDFAVSANLRQDFLRFATKHLNAKPKLRTVFVIPAFEMPRGRTLPANKEELLAKITEGVARPYHMEDCWTCQAFKQLHWMNVTWANELQVLEEVIWEPKWEPYHISRNDAPFYDERFQQYGGDRISQVCTMHVTGYTFAILNDAFAVHRGLKIMKVGGHRGKLPEMEQNKHLYREYQQELYQRYPDSWRRC